MKDYLIKLLGGFTKSEFSNAHSNSYKQGHESMSHYVILNDALNIRVNELTYGRFVGNNPLSSSSPIYPKDDGYNSPLHSKKRKGK